MAKDTTAEGGTPMAESGEYPEAKVRDLATIDLMLDHMQRLVAGYQAHADGLTVGLPERSMLDRSIDLTGEAVDLARAAWRDLFDAVTGADQ